MKKIIIAVAALAVSVSSFAQVSVGAGYLNSSATQVTTISEGTTNTANASSNGFYVQGLYAYPLASGLDLNAGLKFYWDTRTSTGNVDFGGVHFADATAVTKEAYLALPVNVSYGYSINKDVRIFAFAGPTFSLGLSSKTNVTTSVLGQTSTDTIDNYAKDDEGNRSYKTGNVFLGGGIGVDLMKMVRVNVSYDFGLVNRSTADKTKLTENLLSVGVAFLF